MRNKYLIPDRFMVWIRRLLVASVVFFLVALAYYLQGLAVHREACQRLEARYPDEVFSFSPLGCMRRAPHGMTDGYFWQSVDILYDLDTLADLYE